MSLLAYWKAFPPHHPFEYCLPTDLHPRNFVDDLSTFKVPQVQARLLTIALLDNVKCLLFIKILIVHSLFFALD